VTRRLDGEPVIDGNCCLVRIDGLPPSTAGLELDGFQYSPGMVQNPVVGSFFSPNFQTTLATTLGGTDGQVMVMLDGGELTFTVIGMMVETGAAAVTHTLRLYRDVQNDTASSTLLEELQVTVDNGEPMVFEFATHTFVDGDLVALTHTADDGLSDFMDWTVVINDGR